MHTPCLKTSHHHTLWETFVGNKEVKRKFLNYDLSFSDFNKPMMSVVKAGTIHSQRLQDVEVDVVFVAESWVEGGHQTPPQQSKPQVTAGAEETHTSDNIAVAQYSRACIFFRCALTLVYTA